MLSRKNPYITSLEEGYENLNETISIVNLTKHLISVTEMKDGEPFTTIDLLGDNWRYINIRLKHIEKKHDANGTMTQHNNYYPAT